MRLFLSLLLLIPSLAFAAVPSAWPNGENAGGLFSVYFQNMTSTSCASGEAITGFSVSATTYLRPTCQPIASSLAWSLSGNTITPWQYIGTNNSVSLIFRTNASSDTSTKMIITTTWAVGIWTDAPTTALDVNWVTRAVSFTDTTNGTWFPWTTTGFNYIRGTTYFSGFLVDEQNANFYINPAQVSVMSWLAISGVITWPTPVAPRHLTTKAYVDAAIANINAAPWAGTVYQEFHGWTVGSCPAGWTYIAGWPIYGEWAWPTVVCGIANTGIVYREFWSDNNEPCPTGWVYVGVWPKYWPGKSNIVCGIWNTAALPTPPVNAACSTTVNTCTVWTPTSYNAGSCGWNATWTCNGSNGWTNASCTKANAACNAPPCNSSYGENGWTCYCASWGTWTVYGSSPYAKNSDVCRAAQHVWISLPANVTVIVWSLCSNFVWSSRNSVTTSAYAPLYGTYHFQWYGAQTCVARTNGSCGSSANTCDAGSPSWYSAWSCGWRQRWTCNGSNGWTNASCSLANAACTLACPAMSDFHTCELNWIWGQQVSATLSRWAHGSIQIPNFWSSYSVVRLTDVTHTCNNGTWVFNGTSNSYCWLKTICRPSSRMLGCSVNWVPWTNVRASFSQGTFWDEITTPTFPNGYRIDRLSLRFVCKSNGWELQNSPPPGCWLLW